LFAALHRLGLAGKGLDRPTWADDHEMELLLLTGLLFLTARRLVFENGLYGYALQEARDLGLLEPLTLAQPASPVSSDRLHQARARRMEVLITNEGILASPAQGTSAHSTWPEAEPAAVPKPLGSTRRIWTIPFGTTQSPDGPGPELRAA
jgi:hypothetical protein